jgi:hypothetical protein
MSLDFSDTVNLRSFYKSPSVQSFSDLIKMLEIKKDYSKLKVERHNGKSSSAYFEAFMAVKIQVEVFWVVTACSIIG